MRLARLLGLVLGLLVVTSGRSSALELEPCGEQFGESALCGWAEVSEDRADPESRKIRLRVVVLPSRGEAAAEPVVMFPGGPGQATTTLIPLASQLYPGVLESRDAVFIGQRGSGESNAMHCLEGLTSDPALVFGALWNRERMRECHERTLEFADPSHYTTAEYVADVAEVLDLLGYERIVIWGGSGGTRIGQAFIRENPERVLAAVLDGVTPIDYAMPLPFSEYAQRAWQRVVDDCTSQPDCAGAYPALAADFDALLRSVAEAPVSTVISAGDGSPATVQVGAGDLAYAVRGILYNSRATAKLPAEIHRAARSGDLSFFAQSLYDRARALLGGVVAVGLHIASYCAEDIPRLAAVDIEAATRGTFIGSYLVDEYRGACEAFPVPAASQEWYRAFESSVPTLLLSGYYDPSTPDLSAERVQRSLPNSRHIVVRNSGHGAGFTCARSVVEDFLVSASLDGVVDPCADEPIHFEVRAGESGG